MSSELDPILARADDAGWREALRWAGRSSLVSSAQTRRSYQRDLRCWFGFCATHDLHPYESTRRTHVELYLRELEQQLPRPSNATLHGRISTLSSWFAWLEDEEVILANPAARVRRPSRHPRPQPWLDRNELADLLAAGEDEGGYPYALVYLLALNGLRVSEACGADIADLGGWRYQPTLQVIGKGDKPALIALNPRTYQPLTVAWPRPRHGPLLLNRAQRRMQRHNAAVIIRRLAATAGIARRVTPHASRRSTSPWGSRACPCETQRAARHAKADTTVGYDQSERSFHKDPTFVIMAATAC